MSSRLTDELRLVFSSGLNLKSEEFSIYAIFDLANSQEGREELFHELFIRKKCPKLNFNIIERERENISNSAYRFHLNTWLLKVVKWAVKNAFMLNITSIEPFIHARAYDNSGFRFMMDLKIRTELIFAFAEKNKIVHKMGFSYDKISNSSMKGFNNAHSECNKRGCSCWYGSEFQKGLLPIQRADKKLREYLYSMNCCINIDTDISFDNNMVAYDLLQTLIYTS